MRKLYTPDATSGVACRQCHGLDYSLQRRKNKGFAFVHSLRKNKLNKKGRELAESAGTVSAAANPPAAPLPMPWRNRIESLPQSVIGELTSALSLVDSPTRRAFVAALYDPRYRTRTVVNLAHKFGITPSQLTAICREYALSIAEMKLIGRLPELADRIMQDALGAKVACPRCDGAKRIEVPENMREFFQGKTTTVCPNCAGVGTVRQPGSSSDRNLVWDAVGWSNRQGLSAKMINNSSWNLDSTLAEMDEFERSFTIDAEFEVAEETEVVGESRASKILDQLRRGIHNLTSQFG